MLKKRIAAVLVVKEGIVVQSCGFSRYLPVGKPSIAVEFLDDWGVDEIILLDMSATQKGTGPDNTMIRNAASRGHVPLTVGGGISTIDQMLALMHCGADKVSFNQICIYQPELLSEAAKLFGNQCIVASIDAQRVGKDHRVYEYRKRQSLPMTAAEFALRLQDLGVGEILINSVDHDGAQCGFDLSLIDSVCRAVTIPVIACGGAGTPQHFIEVLEQTGASAAAAANFFHFTEHSVTTTKAWINRRLPMRHETHVTYDNNRFDSAGRLLKKNEHELEALLYQRIEKEII